MSDAWAPWAKFFQKLGFSYSALYKHEDGEITETCFDNNLKMEDKWVKMYCQWAAVDEKVPEEYMTGAEKLKFSYYYVMYSTEIKLDDGVTQLVFNGKTDLKGGTKDAEGNGYNAYRCGVFRGDNYLFLGVHCAAHKIAKGRPFPAVSTKVVEQIDKWEERL